MKMLKIASRGLKTMGLGESQPIDPANLESGAKRRVQVVDLGSASKIE